MFSAAQGASPSRLTSGDLVGRRGHSAESRQGRVLVNLHLHLYFLSILLPRFLFQLTRHEREFFFLGESVTSMKYF